MVNVLRRKIRVNDGFGVSKTVTSRLQARNIENCKKSGRCGMQALLDEDDSQTQKQLVEKLGVTQ